MDQLPQSVRTRYATQGHFIDMLFVDHGIFRVAYLNKHRLGKEAWRSAQPAPHQLRRMARRGVKTIVNLRGDRECGGYELEKATCEAVGLKLVNYKVRSRAAPTYEEVAGAKVLFESLEYPILMHCKSGADRAGLMSVLYRYFHEGVPIAEARKELALKFGHIRQADTGVLDYFFDTYVAANARQPIDLLDWMQTAYDANELKSTFVAKGWANRVVNSLLKRE